MGGEKIGTIIRIISGSTTAELAKGEVGEETIEHLAGGKLLTRREITEALANPSNEPPVELAQNK